MISGLFFIVTGLICLFSGKEKNAIWQLVLALILISVLGFWATNKVAEKALEEGKEAAQLKIDPKANPYASDSTIGPFWLKGYQQEIKKEKK